MSRLRFGAAVGVVPPGLYDVLITNDAELDAFSPDAAVAAHPSPVYPGKLTVAIAPGFYTGWNYPASSTTTFPITFAAYDPDDKPIIDGTLWKATNNKVTFEDIWFCTTAWFPFSPGAPGSLNFNGAFRCGQAASSSPDFHRCKFGGNYKGDHTYIFPLDDLEISPNIFQNRQGENAVVVGTGAGGAVTNLRYSIVTVPATGVTPGDPGTITTINNFVGSNCDPSWIDGGTGMIADGNWPLILSPGSGGSGTGFVGTMTTVAGAITGFNVTAGGTGYTAGTLIISWLGQEFLNACIPSAGIRSNSGANYFIGQMNLYECEFMNSLWTNIRETPRGAGSALRAHRCLFQTYADGAILGSTQSVTCEDYEFTFNVTRNAWFSSSDLGAPHADAYQPNGTHQTWTQPWPKRIMKMIGNVVIAGPVRGSGFTGFLATGFDGVGTTHGVSVQAIGNYFLTTQQANAFRNGLSDGSQFRDNVVVRWDVAETIRNAVARGDTAFNSNLSGLQIVGNIVDGFASTGSGADMVEKAGNLVLGKSGVTIPYTDVFANPLAQPQTMAETLAAFATIGAAAGMGPQNVAGIDFTNFTVDYDQFPPFVKFANVINQDQSTDYVTPWCRLMGGLETGTISVTGTGVTFQIADEFNGTGATGDLTTYTGLKRDKFIRLKCTAIGAPLTTVETDLQIDSTHFLWYVTTEGNVAYTLADNGSNTYSSIAIPSQGGLLVDRIAIAFVGIIDADVALSRLFGSTSGVNGMNLSWQTGGIPSITINNGGMINKRPISAPPNASEVTITILIDLSTTVQAERLKIMYDADLIDIDEAYNAGTGASISLDTLLSATYRIFANSSGATSMNTKAGMFFFDAGKSPALGGSFVLPSVATYADQVEVFTKFQADLIGATGAGPLGHQPRLCFYGAVGASDGSTPNSWNATAGLTNRGDIATGAIRGGGTYS